MHVHVADDVHVVRLVRYRAIAVVEGDERALRGEVLCRGTIRIVHRRRTHLLQDEVTDGTDDRIVARRYAAAVVCRHEIGAVLDALQDERGVDLLERARMRTRRVREIGADDRAPTAVRDERHAVEMRFQCRDVAVQKHRVQLDVVVAVADPRSRIRPIDGERIARLDLVDRDGERPLPGVPLVVGVARLVSVGQAAVFVILVVRARVREREPVDE